MLNWCRYKCWNFQLSNKSLVFWKSIGRALNVILQIAIKIGFNSMILQHIFKMEFRWIWFQSIVKLWKKQRKNIIKHGKFPEQMEKRERTHKSAWCLVWVLEYCKVSRKRWNGTVKSAFDGVKYRGMLCRIGKRLNESRRETCLLFFLLPLREVNAHRGHGYMPF